jgi:hypothetical protein
MMGVLRRSFLITAALAAAVVTYAFVTAPPKRLILPAPASKTVVSGAYHVHTTHSDGAFTPDQVAEAAPRESAVRHSHGSRRRDRTPDAPRYVNGVLVIDAVESAPSKGTSWRSASRGPRRNGSAARRAM